MKRLLITLLIVSLLFITGCSDVSKESTDGILNKLLYLDSNLNNTYMEGFSVYLPHGTKLIDKNDFNLTIGNDNNVYYLYLDVISYHYKTTKSYNIDVNHVLSKNISYNGKVGFIDIQEIDDKYYIVLEYNYAKMESFIKKEDLNDSLIVMSSIISSIKYNDVIIDDFVGETNSKFQEEKFNIFKSDKNDDNFLKYEDEFGTYKEDIVISNNDDIIDIDEIVE